jgi:hypothetical protein
MKFLESKRVNLKPAKKYSRNRTIVPVKLEPVETSQADTEPKEETPEEQGEKVVTQSKKAKKKNKKNKKKAKQMQDLDIQNVNL